MARYIEISDLSGDAAVQWTIDNFAEVIRKHVNEALTTTTAGDHTDSGITYNILKELGII